MIICHESKTECFYTLHFIGIVSVPNCIFLRIGMMTSDLTQLKKLICNRALLQSKNKMLKRKSLRENLYINYTYYEPTELRLRKKYVYVGTCYSSHRHTLYPHTVYNTLYSSQFQDGLPILPLMGNSPMLS